MPEKVKKKLNTQRIKADLHRITGIQNKVSRQRAFVSMLAITAFSEFLEEKGIKIPENSGLYNFFLIQEEFDIADIKTENNVVIDIRAVVGDEYPQMCVPKEHFSLSGQPDIYVGVKIDKSLKEAEFAGYIKTGEISGAQEDQNYYIVDAGHLNSVLEIEDAINSIQKTEKTYTATDHEKAAELFIPFIDRTISKEDKTYLITHLADCYECRKAFAQLFELDTELKSIKNKLSIEDTPAPEQEAIDTVFVAEEPEIKAEKPEKETKKDEEYTLEILDDDSEEKPEDGSPEIPEEPRAPAPPKKRHHRDWADELAADLIIDRTPEKSPEEVVETGSEFEDGSKAESAEEPAITSEDVSVSESSEESLPVFDLDEGQTGINFDEELPVLDFSEEQTEHKDDLVWEEDTGDIGIKDDDSVEEPSAEPVFEVKEEEPEEDLVSETPKHKEAADVSGIPKVEDDPEESPVIENKKEFAEIEILKPEEKDPELEDILETLDEVEIVNEEDDIDSLLSFIEPDDIEKPFEDFQSRGVSSSGTRKETYNKFDKTEKRGGDYSTVLDSGLSKEEEHMDIFLYEEKKNSGPIEEITQEDLLSIFDPAAAAEESKKKKEKEAAGFLLQNFLKDKNVAALTTTAAISTIVLFLYLVQVNSHVDVAVEKKDNKSSEQVDSEKKEDNITEIALEKREREPLKFYTRQIMKTVNNENASETAVKKHIKELSPPEPEKEEESEAEIKPRKLRIENISWELGASVARQPKVKKYFLDIGYMLREALSKKLYDPKLDVTSARIEIYGELNSRGNIVNSFVYEGSGVEEIDKNSLKELYSVIAQSKLPEGVVDNRNIKFKLLIKI